MGEFPRGNAELVLNFSIYHSWFFLRLGTLVALRFCPLTVEIRASLCLAMGGGGGGESVLGWLPPDILGMAAESGPSKG